VSATYYTRLEQGESHQASPSVIEALADALQLSDDERIYLHTLVRPAPAKPRRSVKPANARPGTRQLIDALSDVAAIVIGTRTEVLAWNALGHRLLAGHLDADAPYRPAGRPNLTRMLFLDTHHRDLYPNWETAATCAVASLRMTASRHKDDRELSELVGELSVNSEEFATLWSNHPVAEHAYGTRHLRHPEVGELQLELETATLMDGSGHQILMYSAPAGSPSRTALQLMRMSPAATEPHDRSTTSTRPAQSFA
jgi:hypothetical protein